MNSSKRQTSSQWSRDKWSQAANEARGPSIKSNYEYKELTAAEKRHFGDVLHRRTRDDELLIGALNINGLPETRRGEKNFDLTNLMLDMGFDHIGLSETGRCWPMYDEDDRLPQRFRGHFMSKQLMCSTAYNTRDKISGPYQHGGTASLSTGNLVGRKKATGSDLSRLGRWCWQLFRGSGEATLRIVTFYRPVPPSDGGNSVYAQHLTHFSDIQRDICPRVAFLDDLSKELNTWISEGDQVIIMGDINDYIGSHKIRSFFAKHGMRELIVERHGASGPATTRSNTKGQAVDGIWGTAGLSIMAGGYLPFHKGPKSDHRLLWIRISHQSAFGAKLQPSLAPAARKLRLRHPRGQDSYTATLKTITRAHRILERFRKLSSIKTRPPTKSMIKEYEELDKYLMKGRDKANSRCRRLHMSAVQSSRVVKIAKLRIRLANLLYKRKTEECKIKLKTVTKLATVTGRHWWLRLEAPAILAQKCLARRQYYALRKESGVHRSTYIEDLAKQRTREGKPEEAQRLHSMLREEQDRERSARLRLLKPRPRGVGVNRLTVKRRINGQQDPVTVDINKRGELETESMREINDRFRMSFGTPCMVPPLVNELRYNGMTEYGDKLLLGTAEPIEGVDEHTQMYLDQLKAVEGALPEPATPIPFQDYKQEVNRLREATSSGISIVTPAMVKTEVLDTELAEIGWHRFNFPWCTGYSPLRYRRCTDLLIHKDAFDFRPERLRPIRLFDIEANMHNKCLGRFMMRRAEGNGGLAVEQYGSRAFMAADIQALNTRLYYDLIRLKRIPATSVFADLVSNYDLVVHSMGALAMRRVGTPSEPILCTVTTLQDMVSAVRTAFGDSANTTGGDIWAVPLNPPPQGLGQGNGAAPAIWAVVSTPILNSLRAAGFGAAFKCCLSGETFKLVGYCFVDDSTLIQIAPTPFTSTAETVKLAQRGLDLFVGTAAATGGQVSERKSKWYLLEFRWDRAGKWTLANNAATMSVATPKGRKVIERLPVNQASRILGVWISPDGSSAEQTRQLRKITEAWADRVRSGHIRKEDAWHFYQTTVKKSIEYPLVATTLSASQCRQVQAPARTAALSATGLTPNMNLDVVAGPTSTLGLGDGSMYATQGKKHISAILNFGNSNTITGHHIRDAIEAHKLEVGCGGSLFSNNHPMLRHAITQTWISHTWKFLWERNLCIEDQVPDLLLQRENDAFLMEEFLQAGYKGEELAELNRCRLFLRVTCLSDICSGDGHSVRQAMMDGRANEDTPRYDWPRQVSPDKNAWDNWRAALSSSLRLSKTLSLPSAKRLGPWLTTASPPDWLYSAAEDRVYRRSPTGWHPYRPILERRGRARRRRFILAESPTCASPPEHCQRTVCDRGKGGKITGTGIAPTATGQELPAEDASLSIWNPDSEFVFSRTAEEHIAQAIRDGDAIAVSDGSFKEFWGTAAFILEGKIPLLNRLSGSCTCPGWSQDQEAYRSELSGIYCIIRAIHYICRKYEITEGKVTVACDGLEAIRKAMAADATYSCLSSHFDIISAIDKSLELSPISWEWRHVKGHQDDHFGPLDRWASLNVEADTMAKQRWADDMINNNGSKPSRLHRIDGEMWRLYAATPINNRTKKRCTLRGVKVSTKLSELLDKLSHRQPLLSYWDKKGTLPTKAQTLVDMDALARAADSSRPSRRRWATRQAARLLPTGDMMKNSGLWRSAACPRGCGEKHETAEHVFKCTGADERWLQLARILRLWGSNNNAAPGLMTAILHGLTALRRDATPTAPTNVPDTVRDAFQAQTQVGWDQVLYGFVVEEWTQVQSVHLLQAGSKLTPSRWTASLIKKMWDVSWDMWSHRNHILHSTDGPTKMKLIATIATRITYHHRRGMRGLPERCRFLFRSPLESILSRPARQRLTWLAAISSARLCANRRACKLIRHDTDKRLLAKLIDGRQLSQLVRVDNPPPLRTRAGPDRTRLLYIARDSDPSPCPDPDDDDERHCTHLFPA